MKDLIIGLCVGTAITGLCSYLVFSPSSEGGDTSANGTSVRQEKRESLFPHAKKSTAYSTSSNVRTASSGGKSGGSRSLARFRDFQTAESSQDQLRLANDVHKLNLEEIQELLDSPEIKGLHYMDQSGIMVMNAAFSRLVQIDPQQAMKTLELFNGQMQRQAAMALFKEWSLNDHQDALSHALAYQDNTLRVSALSGVLGELSKNDPEKAFDLAKEHKVQQAQYTIMLNWGKVDPVTAFEKSSELGQQGEWVRKMILNAWATRDQEAALSHANSLQSTKLKSEALSGIVSGLVLKDLDQAYEILGKYSSVIKDEQLYSLTHSLGQKDPQRAMEWLSTRKASSQNTPFGDHIYGNIMGQWIKNDQEAALAYYEQIKDSSEKSKIGTSILQRLAYQDPKRVLELYDSFEFDKGEGRRVLERAISKLAGTDLDEARSYVEGISNEADRKSALHGLVSGLVNDDPEKALEFAEQLSDPTERNHALGKVYDEMANDNAAFVAEHFLSQGVNKIGDYSMSSLMSDYARQDLEGAKEFLGKIKDPLIRDRVVGQLLGQWAAKDPLAALEYAYTQPQTEGVTNAMFSIGSRIAGKNPQEGLQIAFSKPNNKATKQLVEAIYKGWLRHDFDAAVEGLSILNANGDNRQIQTGIYYKIGSKYSNEPEKGKQWIATIQNDQERNSATSSFVKSWARNEPNKAVDWVNTLDEGKQRDSAVYSLVGAFDNAEPAYALEWASSLSNNKRRTRAIKRTFQNWQKRDRAAAQQWLSETDILTDAQRSGWKR